MYKLKKWYRNHLTTQFWIYAVLLSIAILLCLFPLFSNEKKEEELSSGIGSGMIASVVVAILIDYGNTKQQRDKGRQQFMELNTEYRNAFYNLRESVARAFEQRFGSIDEQLFLQNGWIRPWISMTLQKS